LDKGDIVDIIEKTQLLAEMLEVRASSINAATLLDSIPTWDSMAALSLIILLEENFGRLDIDGNQIKNMKTVEDIFNVME
jgi:acyl carrier protein